VAVELLSFDEARDLFLAAKDDAALKAVRRFGSDGNALSPVVTGDPGAAVFAAQTHFQAATFISPFEAGHDGDATMSAFLSPFAAIKAKIREKAGSAGLTYAYTAYDSLWLAGLAYKRLGSFQEAAKVVTAVLSEARDFRGPSGAMRLSPAGDRTVGDFGFFEVQGNAWVRKAIYHGTDGLTGMATGSPALTYEGVTP